MFERFTDRARRATVLAQEQARLLNHTYIGTEHILLGLIAEGEGVAAVALEAFGVTLEDFRKQVEETIGRGESVPNGHVPFTPRAKKCLELALREALQLGHNYIGTEHIFLGILREGEGLACQLLQRTLNLDQMRGEVIRLLSPQASAPTLAPMPDLPPSAMQENFVVHATYPNYDTERSPGEATYDEALAVGQKYLADGAHHFTIEKRYGRASMN